MALVVVVVAVVALLRRHQRRPDGRLQLIVLAGVQYRFLVRKKNNVWLDS